MTHDCTTRAICPYDLLPLRFDDKGREDACPECERDISEHNAQCSRCRGFVVPDLRLDTPRRLGI